MIISKLPPSPILTNYISSILSRIFRALSLESTFRKFQPLILQPTTLLTWWWGKGLLVQWRLLEIRSVGWLRQDSHGFMVGTVPTTWWWKPRFFGWPQKTPKWAVSILDLSFWKKIFDELRAWCVNIFTWAFQAVCHNQAMRGGLLPKMPAGKILAYISTSIIWYFESCCFSTACGQ